MAFQEEEHHWSILNGEVTWLFEELEGAGVAGGQKRMGVVVKDDTGEENEALQGHKATLKRTLTFIRRAHRSHYGILSRGAM